MDRRNSEPDDLVPATFEEEEAADLRRIYLRHAVRAAIAFVVLFAGVYLAFWWSGAAVSFSAAKIADRATPTWSISGTVRDVVTGAPVPWARIEDSQNGQPPLFQADADHLGRYELRTLSESHEIRISANGYRSATFSVGRVWFLWLPHGRQRLDCQLQPL